MYIRWPLRKANIKTMTAGIRDLRTSNMFLFGSALLWTGCLLDVDREFLFRLVLVYRPSGIMYFVIQVSARPLIRKPGCKG